MKLEIPLKVSLWPLLNKLLETQRLSYIDYYLAETLLGEATSSNEGVALFISYLSLATREGHLCLRIDSSIEPEPKQLLMQSSVEEKDDLTEQELQEICERIHLGSQQIPSKLLTTDPVKKTFVKTPLCQWKNLFYLQKNWYFETLFIEHFQRLEQESASLCIQDDALSAYLEQRVQKKELYPEQAQAIKNSLRSSLSFIYGGPGTGKTYTAAWLINTYWNCLSEEQKKHCEIVLAAPTGKAAARLNLSLQNSIADSSFELPTATTLHSLLSVHPYSTVKPRKLKADLIMVDESSMVDIKMMAFLLCAIKEGARLILLGDPNQLPSVEGGSIFADMIDYQTKKGKDEEGLKTSMRTKNSVIRDFSEMVNLGNSKKALDILSNQHAGILLHSLGNPQHVVREVAEYYSNCPLELFGKCVFLTPMRKGPFGINALNQQIFNEILKLGQHNEYLYIPIIITSNDTRYHLHNGDLGILCHYRKEGRVKDYAIFYRKDSELKIPLFHLPSYEYAYCLTIYKGQGSEYDKVCLLMPEGSEWFGREALYTAATRARNHLEIWGDPETLRKAIEKKSHRLSGFTERVTSDEL